MPTTRYHGAIAMFDARNADDPNTTLVDGNSEPNELIYAKRMTDALATVYPDASEALKLAVRAQHIERWKIPRNAYPDGRSGYHAWRNELKRTHARTAASILNDLGYDEGTITTVEKLITKTDLRSNAETQALEDTACIVFLKYYARSFAEKHEPKKVGIILEKTWKKMSSRAHTHVASLKLDEPIHGYVQKLKQTISSSRR